MAGLGDGDVAVAEDVVALSDVALVVGVQVGVDGLERLSAGESGGGFVAFGGGSSASE